VQPAQFLEEIAQAVRLREGPMGVRSALWSLAWRHPLSTKEWAQACRFPIPVVAAIRGELVRRGLLKEGRRPCLTAEGARLLRQLFGESCDLVSRCPVCHGNGLVIPAGLASVLDEFTRICAERPPCDVTLDQSHGTPDTGIRRALILVEKGLVAGRRVVFLGDDDIVSLALGLVVQLLLGVRPALRQAQDTASCRSDRLEACSTHAKPAGLEPFVVLDIDERFITFIRSWAARTGVRVDARLYDARTPLPADLAGSCHTVMTDPPYTPNGIVLFALRAAQLLSRDGGDLLLSYADPPPDDLLRVEEQLNRQGWVTVDLWPGFNRYEGSAIHAHQSTLRHLYRAGGVSPENAVDLCYSPLYTGDVRAPGGQYRCVLCQTAIDVGPGHEHLTVADLKRSGCPECGGSSFRRYGGGSLDD